MGLLEVVPDELVELRRALGKGSVQMVGERLVERRPLDLWDRVVGRVPQQDVAEPKPPAAADIRRTGTDDVLQQELVQVLVQTFVALLGDQRSHRRMIEHLAHDGRGLDHPPFGW
jgi:hypothetical protein